NDEVADLVLGTHVEHATASEQGVGTGVDAEGRDCPRARHRAGNVGRVDNGREATPGDVGSFEVVDITEEPVGADAEAAVLGGGKGLVRVNVEFIDRRQNTVGEGRHAAAVQNVDEAGVGAARLDSRDPDTAFLGVGVDATTVEPSHIGGTAHPQHRFA